MPGVAPEGPAAIARLPSTALKAARRLFVYTPPGYEASTERYPVLYLLHGSGGDEHAWNEMGSASVILNRQVKVAFKTYPGAHEWRVWRSSLADLAQLLFQ